MSTFDPLTDLELHDMETHSGIGLMDGVDGIIKNQVFKEVKFSRLSVSTPKTFGEGGSNLTASFISLYLPINEDETENITNAPAINRSTDYKEVSIDREVLMWRSILSFQTKKPFISLSFTDIPLTLMLLKSSMKILLDAA